jgi:hypothetical protein
MPYKLFTRVALREDLPAKHLRKGDVATIVEHHPSGAGGRDGYSLEIFNAVGETIAIVTVSESAIEPLHENEVLHVRQLEDFRA